MAQKIRAALICALLLLTAAVVWAASQEDIKKFPPVSGEIFGQAATGVRSISINGRPVTFDAAQNFRTNVSLKAGEKYLTLVVNYENLRIIKKYLILRKTAGKFKVQVTKEKIEQAVQAAKETHQAAVDKRAEQRRRLARLARLKAKAREAERRRIEKEIAEEAARQKRLAREKAERAWLRQVASPKYYANEFRDSGEATALLKQINDAGYLFPFRARENNLDRLNQVLAQPNFYDLVRQKNPNLTPNAFLRALIAETQAFRYKPFNQLTAYQQKKILFLNRLLLEALFSNAPRRSTWLAPQPIPTFTKTKQYLYVWEFSEGRLLAVKEKQGSYTADIYIPVSKQWMSLKGLSEKDLQELINKPIKSFKPPKPEQKPAVKQEKNPPTGEARK